MSDADLSPVSVESSDGRVLTGVGITPESLEKVVERHEPATAPTSGAAPASPDTPKQSRGQKRFSELTREREDAKRDAEAARKEAADLRAQLAQRAAPPVEPPVASSPAAAAGSAATSPAAPSPTRPKPSEDQVGTKYDSYADFVEDLADWKNEQRLSALDFDARIRHGIEADRASRSFDEHVGQIKAKAREVYPDFDTVLESGAGTDILLGPTEAVSAARIQAIMAEPHAEHMLYSISKSEQVATWLAGLSDVEFGKALARFAPAGAPVASPASTAPRVPVTAPAPYQPVGSSSKTAALSSADLPKKSGYDFDKSGYREKRAAERGVTVRR